MSACGDKVGTYAGYIRHRNNDEEACEPCKKAASKYHKDWRAKNPGYDKKRPPNRHRKLKPETRKNNHLSSRYGVTLNQWQEIFEWQDFRCKCCGTDEEHDRQKPWQVDHDHETGAIRGIICSRCNRLLAQAGDSAYGVAATLARLLVYLAASGDGLTEEQIETMVGAIRRGVRLVGEGEADPNRAPVPQHEVDKAA